jgi:hypothetical protein
VHAEESARTTEPLSAAGATNRQQPAMLLHRLEAAHLTLCNAVVSVGHVGMLADPTFAEIVHSIGLASLGADDKTIKHLTKVNYLLATQTRGCNTLSWSIQPHQHHCQNICLNAT